MRRLLATVLLICWLAPSLWAQNFEAADCPKCERGCRECGDGKLADAEYISAAEAARRDLAIFWTGDVLPAWSAECPIKATTGPNVGAGGATSFAFDRGEVFGWRMTVQGSRERIIDSVIPHEVMHTITASVVRRPTPRWLDEGICTLFEAPGEYRRQRQLAAQYMSHPGSAWRYFDYTGEYPSDMQYVMALYSTGFSIVEWFIDGWGHERLWGFVKDSRPPSQKFPYWYRMSVQDGEIMWRLWLRDRDVNAPHVLMSRMSSYQPSAPQQPDKQTLYVFTTRAFFCLPCLNWKTAHGTDEGFREQLHRMVNVQMVTLEDNRDLATRLGVTAVPAFCVGGRKLEGFHGKQHLLSWVAQTADCAKPGSSAPAPTQPPPSAPPAEPPQVVQGPEGPRGPRGEKGDKGDPGRDGKDADPARVAALEKRIAELEKQLAVLTAEVNKGINFQLVEKGTMRVLEDVNVKLGGTHRVTKEGLTVKGAE